MYITLNSENEPSNAKFKNYFQDTLTIQPNSYICLSSLGLAKDDTDINLGQINSFNFRIAYGSFDFSRNYTVPAGTYTAETLCDTINNLIATASPVWTCKFTVQEVDVVGEAIVVEWTRDAYFRGISQYAQNFLIITNREAALGNSTTANRDAEIVGGFNVWNKFFLRGKVLNNYNYVTAANAPTGLIGARNVDFLVPQNMIGRDTFDINRDQGEISFTIATPKLDSAFLMLSPGQLTTTATGDVIENPTGTLPGGATVQIFYKNNVFDLIVRKRDDTLETIFTNQEYNPGTSFHIKCEADEGATTGENCFAYHVTRKGLTNGQIGWIPFDSLNNDDITPDTAIDMYDTADWHSGGGTLAKYQNTVIGDTMSGIRMGATAVGASTNRYQMNVQYKSNGGVITKGVAAGMPNGRAVNLKQNLALVNLNQHIHFVDSAIESPAPTMFSIGFNIDNDGNAKKTLYGGTIPVYNLAFGNVWTTSSTPGLEVTYTESTLDSEHWDFVQTRNSGPTTHYWRRAAGNFTNWDIWYTDPSGISPIPAPDITAVLDLVAWTISFPTIPGTILDPNISPLNQIKVSVPILTLTLGVDGFEVTFNDRTQASITPQLNGTGANFQAIDSVDYYLSICSNGTSNEAYIMVTDEADNKYWVTQNYGQDPRLPDLNRIGADTDVLTDPTNTDRRFSGNIFDFRIFQYNEKLVGNRTLETYLAIHNQVALYSLNISSDYGQEWLFNIDLIRNEFNGKTQGGGFADYGVLGQPKVWARHNCCFYKVDSQPEVCDNWFSYGDFGFNMTRTIENLDRTEDTIVMGQAAHTTKNMLVVHTDNNDNVLTKGEIPSVSLLEEVQYVGGSPSVIVAEYINLTDDGPDNIITTSVGDEIDNVNVEEQEHAVNVEIQNLPQRSYNGMSHNISSSIYEVPINNATTRKVGDVELVGFSPAAKVWHPLKNSGIIVLNELEVNISDEQLITKTNLVGPTNVAIEIKTKDEIF